MSTTDVLAEHSAAVRRFADLSRDDVAIAGGKGANLGELTRAGLPVPPGFVVSAPAYAAFCEESGLRARLAEQLRDVDVDDTLALEAAARGAGELVAATPMPGWLEEAIVAAYRELAGGDRDQAVAVRSSATAEDTESASFAGMNETFLNIRGADAVVDAVRRCWASLFGARTVFYRATRGFSQADMDIAVVVQRQVAGHARRRHVHRRPLHGPGGPHRHRGRLRAGRERRLGQRLARPLPRGQAAAHDRVA